MSGAKQHYIPQCFQRPFQTKSVGKHEHVWCYRKNQNIPFLARISDVAAERYFYSDKQPSDAQSTDHYITEYENQLAQLLRQLRNIKNESFVPPSVAAEVIAHLTYRAKTIRNTTREGFTSIIKGISDLLKEGFDVQNFPSAPIAESVSDALIEIIKNHPEMKESGLQDETVVRIAYAYLRENSESLLVEVEALLENILQSTIAWDLRDMHCLSPETMYADITFSRLSEMNWSIHEITGEVAILPDCIGIASENGINYEPILFGIKNSKTIIVPIAPNKLLCGVKGLEFTCNTDKFNEFAARCSSELFISNTRDKQIEQLQHKIGKMPNLLYSHAVMNVYSEYAIPIKNNSVSTHSPVSAEYNLVVIIPHFVAQNYSSQEVTKIAEDICLLLEPNNISEISSIHFDDQIKSSQTYAESHIPTDLSYGSHLIRSDNICSLIPSSTEKGKYELHINHEILNLFLNPNQKDNAVYCIKSAANDILLIPIIEKYDIGGFNTFEKILLLQATRSLKEFNRNLSTDNQTIDSEQLVNITKSNLRSVWKSDELNGIKDSKGTEADIVSDILERMSYSMVILSKFTAQAGNQLDNLARKLCDTKEFHRWVKLYDKDMRLAIRWLKEDKRTDAALIAVSHLERLMFGVGIVFEVDENLTPRYEIRTAGFYVNSLPLPFDAILNTCH